jgi:hypothetical protein
MSSLVTIQGVIPDMLTLFPMISFLRTCSSVMVEWSRSPEKQSFPVNPNTHHPTESYLKFACPIVSDTYVSLSLNSNTFFVHDHFRAIVALTRVDTVRRFSRGMVQCWICIGVCRLLRPDCRHKRNKSHYRGYLKQARSNLAD